VVVVVVVLLLQAPTFMYLGSRSSPYCFT
jgi:hypothetical protein